MKKYRVNTRPIVGIVIVLAVIIVILGVLVPQINKEMSNKSDIMPEISANKEERNDETQTENKTIKISLDEWIGWQSLLDANGGLKTQTDSVYGKMGLDIEFIITNDATASSNALIKGDLVGAGYTINRYSFLQDKFNKANVDVIMPFITNYSSGGDGIIAVDNINTIKDLVGKKIGVPRLSEAHTLLVWVVNSSDLKQEEKDQIKDNIIFFADPEETGKAFLQDRLMRQ